MKIRDLLFVGVDVQEKYPPPPFTKNHLQPPEILPKIFGRLCGRLSRWPLTKRKNAI